MRAFSRLGTKKLIEQAIFSCVGFLVAALLALAATPAITRRARRLAEARARLQAPLTEGQAIAERDALRAQHAVEQLRLEQRLAAVQETSALRLIEIGRLANRLVALEEDMADFAALSGEARDLRSQLGAAQVGLNDLTGQRDSVKAELSASEARGRDTETLADEQRARIATLEMRAATLEVRLADAERTVAASAKSANTEFVRLSHGFDERKQMASRLEADLETATRQSARLATDLAAARDRLDEIETQLARSEAAREEAVLQIGRQSARVAERDAAMRALDEEKRAHEEQLRTMTAAAAGSNRAGLEAELAEQGREIERLRAKLAAPRAGGKTAGDQALREAIARLGRDVLRLNGKAIPTKIEAAVVGFERRSAPAHSPDEAEPLHPAPAGKVLQGQPMAPER